MERTIKPLIMEGDHNNAFLPDDIMINILKRLPVKSLIRFQCVCKHWRNLLKTPSFIADHLHHSGHQNPSLLFQWHQSKSSNYQLSLLDRNMQLLEVHNAPLIDYFSDVHIFGSSNGLLCLLLIDDDSSYRSILLWNPATREARHVPITMSDFQGVCDIGFGYSPIVDDYKIVIIYSRRDGAPFKVNQVEVYSLSTKSWKEIEFGVLEGVSVSTETVTANGSMFWFGFNVDEDDDEDIYEFDDYGSIVSFDIANEVFTLIPMPDIGFCREEILTVYENKLAVLCNKSTRSFDWVEMWVLTESASDESGERWRWIDKYYSNDFVGLSCVYPMIVWVNQIVCEPQPPFESDEDEINGEAKVVLYLSHAITNEFKKISIRRYGAGHTIYNYVESLVSIGNVKIEEIDPKF
ncbi:F-box/kelch-repeat protein At3g23880-like [Prosopis cineraria]|uniref:F-box/kelch-repeat protein At3g23880-like n=1 Tax=Prosopis cineraria TaxID=364024 RepID=UPI00240FF9CB|nr:F-box/kelch-repeat protein At3g23880-like [Prosopis cineraria]